MNRVALFGVVSSVFLLTANCSQQGPAATTPGSGGSGGTTTGAGGATGSGGMTSSGGAGGSGGSQGSGGTTSSGGASSGGTTGSGGVTGSGGANTGGTTAKGGTTGTTTTGGVTGSGGATGSGGTTAKGGTTGSGGATGSGGQTQGTGGATGSGGATGTGGGSGTGGATGTGGSSGTITPADVVPDLDGFYWEGTCSGNVSVSGKNCPLYDNGSTNCAAGTSWANRGTIRNKTMTVKGTTGTPYTINFEVRGVAGTRCYTGGTPASTATPSATAANNTWYVGGTQANDSIWNTYELHVSPATGAADVYYLNAFPSNPDWCQREASFVIGYTASFKVLGGGTLTWTVHDSNCQGQQNCGSNEASTTCDAPRTVSLAGMTPAATFTQPPTNTVGTKTFYPQWLYFDVKSVTSP